MKHWPSRFRRLDDALADLPLDEPMLLSELDGFLTGILVGPEHVIPTEWLQVVWGTDDSGAPPFDDPADVRWFADAVLARYNEIARDLGRGKPQPLFDIDERNGDVLWDVWIDGFAQAMDLRPESWAALGTASDPDMADALSRLTTLIAVVHEKSDLDSLQINSLEERAPADIIAAVLHLYAVRVRDGGGPAAVPADERSNKIGRNDPCPCGSGRKSKRCCG